MILFSWVVTRLLQQYKASEHRKCCLGFFSRDLGSMLQNLICFTERFLSYLIHLLHNYFRRDA